LYIRIRHEIRFGEPKRLSNLAKHGLDFADVEEGFDFDGAIVLPAKPSRTGRARFQLIGELNGILIVAIVGSALGSEAFSIINLRPASQKECELHES